MVGSHMFAQYPWRASVKADSRIRGRGFPQTDHAETFYPASVFGDQALRSGQLPLWLPYSFSGIPILGVGLGIGLLYPPKLLTIPLFSPIRQHDVLLVSHLLLAGLAMYGLLRAWGANALGAVFGAVAWELNGYVAFWLVFEHALISAAWLPTTFLGATLAVRKQSFTWAIGAGLAFGMSLLHGLMHTIYAGAVALAVWYTVSSIVAARRSWSDGQRGRAMRCLALPLISGLVAAAVGAVTLAALMDVMPRVWRHPVALEDQIAERVPWSDLVRSLIQPLSASEGPAGKTADFSGFVYMGLPAILLALRAPLGGSATAFAAALCAVSLGFAGGYRPLVQSLRYLLPWFGAIHPYTGLYLFCFGVAILAALGLTQETRRLFRTRLPRRLISGIGLLAIGLEAFQLIAFAWTINPAQPVRPEWLFPETPLVKRLKEIQGEFHLLPVYLRLESGAWTPPVFAGKVAAIFGLRSSSGYESLLPQPTANLWRTVEQGGTPDDMTLSVYRPYFFHDRLALSLLEKTSVGWLVAPPGVRPRDSAGGDPVADGALELFYRGPDGWIYRVTRALPRAFLVPHTVHVADAPAALRLLADRAFDARRAAIVIGDEAVRTARSRENPESGSWTALATIVRDRLNEVEIDSVAPQEAILVFNDSWDPGWKVLVDGRESPLLRINYAFRGVVVPQGRHRVTFFYRPKLVLFGLTVSAGSLLILAIFLAIVGRHTLRNVPFIGARARRTR